MDDTSPKNSPDSKTGIFKNIPATPRNTLVIFLLILVALAHTFLFPTEKKTSLYIPQKDKISQQDIIAPFSYDILKSEKQLDEERKTAIQNVPELLLYGDSIEVEQKTELEEKWTATLNVLDSIQNEAELSDALNIIWDDLKVETINTLFTTRSLDNLYNGVNQALDSIYKLQFVDAEWKRSKEKNTRLYSIKVGDKEKVVTPNQLLAREDIVIRVQTLLGNIFKEYAPLANASFDLLKGFIVPNLIPDELTTTQRRQKALDEITLTKGEVLKDEKIVGIHERVTDEIYEKLFSLEKAYQNRQEIKYPFLTNLLPLFRFVLMLIIIGLFYAYLIAFQKSIVNNLRNLLLIIFLIIIQTISIFFLNMYNLPLELVPISFSAILIVILFNMELSIFLILVTSLLSGFISSFNLNLAAYIIIAGFFSAYLFRKITSRRELYKPMLLFVLLMVVFTVAMELINFRPVEDMLIKAGIIALKSLFIPLFAIMILPIFENLIHITSNITLSELSNTNLPILQQLSVEAPGTYQHSIIVSNLSEIGASAIDANPLQAKIGGLYHDIGKITNPGYFNENLKKENPHYKLSPSMSYLIIKSHVKEGVDLAKSLRIPRVIVDIIQQHHGTSLLEFFYNKAVKTDESVEESDFRYPGPKPQTKEACVVCLADAAEAAARELDNPAEDSITQLVTNIINKKLFGGELDECGITLREITQVKEKFIPILLGVHHKRIR